MDEVEQQKAVADAIILERAAAVLDRRKPPPGSGSLDVFQAYVRAKGHLLWRARELRGEAESGVPSADALAEVVRDNATRLAAAEAARLVEIARWPYGRPGDGNGGK